MTRKTFAVLLFLYCVYAVGFIWQSSFVVGHIRYFSLFDDAMISMRYAKNLVHGDGLVWNPGGERVEGFTSGIWILYLAALHLVPIAASKLSFLVQISAVIFLICNLIVVKKMTERLSDGSPFATIMAVVLTAFYLPLNFWSLEGMEVSLLTLLVSTALWAGILSLEKKSVLLPMYWLLGLAILVRIDLTAIFLGFLVFFWLRGEGKKRPLILGFVVLTISLAVQTVFRRMYFGDFLPNAYYLKMTGYPLTLRLARGFWVFLNVSWKMTAVLLPAVIAGLATKDSRKHLLVMAFLVQVAYSIYVGDDAWEEWGGPSRYITVVMPACFVLFSCGLWKALTKWDMQRVKTRGDASPRHIPAFVTIGLVITLLFYTNAIRGPEAWEEWLLLSKPFHTKENAAMVDRALQVRSLTNAEAKIAVVWAGALPYFMDRTAIDMLGRNDRTIAHEPMRLPPTGSNMLERIKFFYPGHLKYDYAYSIGRLKPDVVTQVWVHPEEAPMGDYRVATLNGVTLMVRKESKNIFWEKIGGPEAVRE